MNFKPVDEMVSQAITEGVFPGACYLVSHKGKVVHRKAQGRDTYCPESKATSFDTVWDLASVSKVVGTTTGAMLLYDQGKLNFDQPVSEIIPEFAQNGKESITVRNLLLHDSGLAAFRAYHQTLRTPEQVIQAIYAEKLTNPVGKKMVYSDLGMITFGKIIEALSGRTFTAFLNEQVFDRLEMGMTMYSPVPQIRERCAPTESIEPWRQAVRKERGSETPEIQKLETQPDGTRWIKGEVHDPTATVLAGVAGHAGLFSTLDDLSKFMAMMMAKGRDLIKPTTVEMFTKRQSAASSRGFGWDTNAGHKASAGSKFSETSFGHTGYTGTSIWGDFQNETYTILLTNRVHPTSENNKLIPWRAKFHDKVFDAIHG